jgi:hypothetical protein
VRNQRGPRNSALTSSAPTSPSPREPDHQRGEGRRDQERVQQAVADRAPKSSAIVVVAARPRRRVQLRMKNCVSPRNEMPTPASSGTMWISSSKQTAGRISRYGSGGPHPAGAGSPSAAVWRRTVSRTRSCSLLREAGPAPGPAARSSVRSARPAAAIFWLAAGQRGLDLRLADAPLVAAVANRLLDGAADDRLHLPLLVDQRHRLGVVGEDRVERLQVRRANAGLTAPP